MRIGEALGAHIDHATLLQALTNLYVTAGSFVPMRTLISTFETEVEDAAVTTRIFYVPADGGLPLFDADNIVVGEAITPVSAFIAPGFITVKDNTRSGGVTLVASNAFSYAPHYSLHGIFAGVSTGLKVVGALQLARELGPGHTVVTVAVDTGLKYLGGDLYDV